MKNCSSESSALCKVSAASQKMAHDFPTAEALQTEEQL
jgi:hypothetical protein